VKREDLDFSLGYLVVPTVAVAVAYKRVTQDKTTGQIDPATGVTRASGFTAQGPGIGASASVPLSGRFSLYGNVAFGIGKARFPGTDAAGQSDADLSYRNGEIGLSYVLVERAAGALLTSVVISAGYRAQVTTTKGVALGTYSLDQTQLFAVQKQDLTSTTDGIVLGFVAIF